MTADDWVFEPRDFLRYWRSLHPRTNDPIRLPRHAMFVFGRDFFDACAKALRARVVDWNPRIALGRTGRRAVAVVRSGIGAPAAAIDLEETIALGARTIVSFGSCGSLLPDLRIGQCVVPTAAFSDEGTSTHYGGGSWARPNRALFTALRDAHRRHEVPVREGAVWTTDAVYRESRSQLRALVRRDVVGVEMEASALFTVGRCRRVRVASVLVVSDELSAGWTPGFEDPAFRAGVRRSVVPILQVLGGAVP